MDYALCYLCCAVLLLGVCNCVCAASRLLEAEVLIERMLWSCKKEPSVSPGFICVLNPKTPKPDRPKHYTLHEKLSTEDVKENQGGGPWELKG